MMQFADIINIVAGTWFGGSTVIGGMIVLTVILGVVMAFSKSAFTTLIVAMPVTLVFSYLRLLPDELVLVMLVVMVLGLAYTGKKAFD